MLACAGINVEVVLSTARRGAVTERLNRVYEQSPSELDSVLEEIQFRSLSRADW